METHVIARMRGIHKQLLAGYEAGATMSAASKGNERETFIGKFLSTVYPNHFRFGTGDAIDSNNHRSGQLDVVIEVPFGPSLPIVGSDAVRLYPAETIGAVIEVKSDLDKQWDEAVATAQKLFPVVRRYDASMLMGRSFPKIPIFIVGFSGWKKTETLQKKLKENPEITGILTLDDVPLFATSTQFDEGHAAGPSALWAFICCLQEALSSMKAGSANFFECDKTPLPPNA